MRQPPTTDWRARRKEEGREACRGRLGFDGNMLRVYDYEEEFRYGITTRLETGGGQ